MGFLCEDVIVRGPGGSVPCERDQWFALLSLGLMPEPDQYGKPLLGEEWKNNIQLAVIDDEALPVTFTAEQARVFADALEFYSAGIPEREEIGEVLEYVEQRFQNYAVTARKGWVETDDVEIVFLEGGKDIIRKMIALLRRGPVKVELAREPEPEPGPRFRVVK